MALTEYQRKRRFDDTPEPKGRREAAAKRLRFVVQKHAASRLHYDFRLELDGVLKSWAVPKGPSLNPDDKRLAMMVEDHPLDYRQFEGTIPEGNYGAGTVMVWDEGTYTDIEGSADLKAAVKNLKAGLASGDLKFQLNGEKLKGDFVLAKMKTGEENSWLLIKKKDNHTSKRDVTKQDKSVVSHKTMTQIGKTATEKWTSPPQLDLKGAPKRNQPATISPMLATLTQESFDNPDWVYEVKWDGYRILAHLKSGEVALKSRGDKDYTEIFAPVAEDLANLKLDCIVDGEVVVLDNDGKSDFGALQNYQRTGHGNLMYYAFDLPYADGHDLRAWTLLQRKEALAQIIAPLDRVQLSEHIDGEGEAFFRAATAQQLEGVMAKAADSHYQDGKRSRQWLKIKTHQRQEAVIGGWTEPRGSRQQLGALILGVFEAGKLRYIGHTGGGLNEKLIDELHGRLEPLERQTSPFAQKFPTNAPAHWVKPDLLCEVSFAEWTSDGHMRQPIFIGLREDKPARNVTREEIKPMPASAKRSGNAKGAPSKPPADEPEITHRDKVFWPKEHITKGDLVEYYDTVAETILPYLSDRAESMNRHPNGIEGKSFFQKDVETGPDWLRTEPIYSESNDKELNWLVCSDRPTLLYMINLGCIELNPWHSRMSNLENPDYCLLDIDAKTSSFENVIKVAQECHKVLEEIGVESYPKTSGKTGLHICIPLGAQYSYDQSRQFAELIVNLVQQRLPKLTSVERNPDKRTGQIYLDFLQNRHGQTMAAPYCVRPVPGATVSTPLKWNEVRKGLNPQKFTIKTMKARLAKVGDLWEPVLGNGIDMAAALDKIKD